MTTADDQVRDQLPTVPDEVAYCLVGRSDRESAPRVLSWISSTEDPELVRREYGSRNADVHFERATTTHERISLETLNAERDR